MCATFTLGTHSGSNITDFCNTTVLQIYPNQPDTQNTEIIKCLLQERQATNTSGVVEQNTSGVESRSQNTPRMSISHI